MEKIFIPQGYQTVMPYIIVDDAVKFMDFMKTVFNATEKMVRKRETGEIMHAEVFIGDSTIMFANSLTDWPPMTAGLYIHVADADATYKKALEQGSTSIQEPADKDYGRSGGVEDPFGNTWWITTTKP